jgi:glycosyltransferase involved in cell wall biosynthesis
MKKKLNMITTKKIYCLIPIYNDWESCFTLINHIEKVQIDNVNTFLFSIIIVNDGSSDEYLQGIENSSLQISILNLKVNIGHQRAIAVGLQYIYNEVNDHDYVVVMDGDGEDKPEDIIRLIEKGENEKASKIIFAQRKKRQESLLFKMGYFLYKYLFYLLTGQKISFGNFSLIPKKLLIKVVHQNNIWNHYSGGIIQSKIPFDKILLDRGTRNKGISKMNFNSLIIHGLSSIAVYFDFLSLRILKFSLYGISICFVSVMYILFQKIFTESAIPGWASSLILIISGIILQLFSVTLIVLLLQLSSRKNINAPNPKIYLDFIESKEELKNKIKN